MTQLSSRRATRFASALALLLVATAGTAAQAQGFGRNKVQYETFDWRIIKSEHFENYFYPAESLVVNDAARMGERWYVRFSDLFRHNFFNKQLVFYADHPDFEQTNVIQESFDESTGGVTESNRTRVIMPFTGVYADNNHVLGHELVHVFQYNIAEGSAGGINRMAALPLWLIEGMAEYLSLGRDDALTSMWMRDAVMRDKFPTINQITTDPRFFPYRYGQALWAYVGGKWGDRAVIDVFRNSLKYGWEIALIRTLNISEDSLSKEWAKANRDMYLDVTRSRTHPDSVGNPIIPLKKSGDFNLAPSVSPDGKHIAFFSSRSMFGLDLFLKDIESGKVRKLASPSTDSHFDALSSINSAGDWSPDSKKFAFLVFSDGNNEVAILDVASANVERRIKVPGVGAIAQVAWSPDGKTLALSGQIGGVTDLFTLDLAAGTLTQLTNDRFADIQPTWSPDGKTIAFVTDRGDGTDFDKLTFRPLRLALFDVSTKQIRLIPAFTHGKSINPQFSPDGRDLYLISNQDGIPDLYRVNLSTGAFYRVTRVATGVSGITDISPALSVARQTGLVVFSVFKDQGQGIYGLEPGEAVGIPVQLIPASATPVSMLPPADAAESVISRYLGDATTGLVSDSALAVVDFNPAFSLDQLGQPSLGVSTGNGFGTMVLGGISGIFGDQLGDQMIFGSIQAQGSIKDIGGQFAYVNLRRRWNWGTQLGHIPYLTGGVFVRDTTIATTQGQIAGYNIYQVLQRVYFDQVEGFAQYPFSTTRRMEIRASYNRLSQSAEAIRSTVVGNALIDERREAFPTQPTRNYLAPTLAYVGDNAQSAFTSPIAGGRYRVEVSPTFGTFTMQSVYADWRRYFFLRPLTFAMRGLHAGRYGKDADSPQLYPQFLGEETLIRGYGYGSFTSDECVTTTNSTTGQNSGCPVFDRLFGSRVTVANFEIRIPLMGVPEYGLINFPDFATHISPFFDAGIATTGSQHPSLRVTRNATAPASCGSQNGSASGNPAEVLVGCAERIPVFSTGVSARINILGYMIFEAYVAHPFQRPAKDWVWGFQMAPGW